MFGVSAWKFRERIAATVSNRLARFPGGVELYRVVERLCRVIRILENGKEIGNYNKVESN